MKRICAIYTRKSTDEGLDKDFNTLDAQREACEAYIASQKSEGWVVNKERYDDGGFSGGSLQRPALQKLIEDIKAGKVNIIVVYKIDRLTRSLMDFSKLVQVFDEYGVTFVSITQSFNTTTSMGRLTLNILLSFAQFEREVSGDRIRDKIAASKARGMWMGGIPPIGYRIEKRQLLVVEKDAKLARHIFDRYLALSNVRALKMELESQVIKTPKRLSSKGNFYGGANFSRGALYWLLRNPVYIGHIAHKGKVYNGLHKAIIPVEIWERVQQQLNNQCATHKEKTARRHMLQGLLQDYKGGTYTPTFTNRHNRQYCYYLSTNYNEAKNHPDGVLARLPAHEIEALVESKVRSEIKAFCHNLEDHHQCYLAERLPDMTGHDLVRASVAKVVIQPGILAIMMNPSGFMNLMNKQLQLSLHITGEPFEVTVPFKAGKAKRGAIVIRPETRDVFDMPKNRLKKLIQGFIWRDEHFAGATLKSIATRESCSEGYVSQAIFGTFDFPAAV